MNSNHPLPMTLGNLRALVCITNLACFNRASCAPASAHATVGRTCNETQL